MDEQPVIEVDHIGHLGLITSLFNDYGLTNKMNLLLPKLSNNQNISHAQAIQCMVYQGLGFSDRRLYSVKDFFSNKSVEKLLSPDITLDMLNSKVLARSLDAIYEYGPEKFFTDVAFSTLLENNLMSKFSYLDTTTHSFYGRKYDKNGKVKICYGHSKGRKDLTQLVQLLVTTDMGLPFWSKSYSGNASDRDTFQEAIISIQDYLFKSTGQKKIGFVADSALYSKKFLLNKEITGDWITRVPESIQTAKKLVEFDHKKAPWIKIDKDLKYYSRSVKYGGVQQRWIIVNNRESRYKEIGTLEKNLKKEEVAIERKSEKLMKRIFYSKEALNIEFKRLEKAHPLFKIRNTPIGHYAKKKKKEKRAKQIGFKCIIGFDRDTKKIKAIKNKKGKFIVATNRLSGDLSDEEIIDYYRGRNRNIEGCFKVLKDSKFRLNEVFLKRVDRIEALMAVMSLSLFVNNLGQMHLRSSLEDSGESVPDQLGKETQKPTLKWAFQLMDKLTQVKVNIFGRDFHQTKGLGEAQKTIIKAFGLQAQLIYRFP